jgi:Fic family protein
LHSLDEQFEKRLPLSHGLLRTVRLLGEYFGKEELYRSQMPQALEALRQAAIIQSTESSNRIEGVTAPAARIRDLVAEKTSPRNRSEQEIAGYRDVLNTIHGNHAAMRLSSNLVLQLHRDLFRYTSDQGGRWKNSPNTITERRADGSVFVRFEPLAPHLVSDAMDDLQRQLRRRWEEDRIDKLLLIPAYVLDFLCIHPFRDGNGRMARLLTLLLLYHSGFEVGRFISLEKIIEESKESYYDTLYQSSQGWHKSTHVLTPWTEYFVGVLVAAYRQFEARTGILTTSRGAKTAMVLEAIERFHGDFSVREIQEQCPNVGVDLIRRILREQRNSSKLECLGRGPAARWRRK